MPRVNPRSLRRLANKVPQSILTGAINESADYIDELEHVISTIANIDTSFLTGLGDIDNYSENEELRRIHEIITPIWNEISK